MTCTANVCGTGGWTGPLPGDPDNNIILMAVPKYGAIEVSWTYPTTNDYAVAFFKVYRGINSDFAQAVEYRIASGNSFLDKVGTTDSTRYYYWIRVVSVHGTVAEPIGPASAVAMPMVDEILGAIAGRITFELLDADLRSGIERIDLFDRNLTKEILDRVAGNASLADALEHVRSDTGEALTYVLSRISEQTTDTEALVTSVNVLAAGLADAQAAIVNEQTVRATEDESLASDVQILYSGLADNQAAILNEQTTRVTQLESVATSLSGLASQYQDNLAAVQAEQTARVNEDAALAASITSLQTQIGTDISALNSSISSIQTSLDGKASSTQLNTLSTTVGEHTASIQTNTSSINGINAKYTVKIDNNGYITGYGLMSTNNNGTPSSAFIIRADSFGLVMPGYGNYVPFSIGPAGVTFNGKAAWENITGTGKPADNATKGATFGVDVNGQINSGNISTYIANAAIGTLSLAGNSVTVQAQGSGGSSATCAVYLPYGGSAFVVAQTYAQGGSGATSLTAQITCSNGQSSMNMGQRLVVDGAGPADGSIVVSAIFTLGAGTHTFTVNAVCPNRNTFTSNIVAFASQR